MTTTIETCKTCNNEIGGGVVKKAIDGLCGFCHRQREIAKLAQQKHWGGYRTRQNKKCDGCGTTLWSGENRVCAGCIIDYDTTGSRFV